METLSFKERKNSDGFDLYNEREKVGEVTFIKINPDAISINHTFVDERFRGNGYGKLLVEKVRELAQDKNWKLSATCWYADEVIQSYE